MEDGFKPIEIKRSERGSIHRCPSCNHHLRRLGTFNKIKGDLNRIEEHGFACPNHKCKIKVLETYDRLGLTAFQEKADPHPDHVKTAERLMARHKEMTTDPKKVEPESLDWGGLLDRE